MPWKEKNAMDLKKEFVLKSLSPNISFRDLCHEYNISPTTGYKWKNRFLQYGFNGLYEKSRRPKSNPNQTSEDVICDIIRLKLAHRKWGSKKIRKLYASNNLFNDIPSRSTFDRIFDKAGLVKHKKKRSQRKGERIINKIKASKPNDIWTVDFKGWWYTCEDKKCSPLTVRDHYSKYIFSIKALESASTKEVREEFERLFKQYGLPKVIRSDNGPPFACTRGLLGLTRLSVWWLLLGIDLDRITPGKPYENGSHERMHRDIKFELQGHIDGGLKKHQVIFDEWRNEYNDIRPHEALDMQTPSDVYEKSKKKYNGIPDEIVYPVGYIRRKVGDRGFICLDRRKIFISYAFYGYYVGLKEIDDNIFEVWFDNLRIGEIDHRTLKFSSSEKIVLDNSE